MGSAGSRVESGERFGPGRVDRDDLVEAADPEDLPDRFGQRAQREFGVPEQQFWRLHLIANNSRFVILTPGRVPNLASLVLGLSLRRLSADMEAVHGYPALLAETRCTPERAFAL